MKRLNELLFKYIITQKTLLVFLFTANILFLLYLLLLGAINRLASDDYMFAARMNTYGFLGSIQWWYHHWQGRFTAHLIINTILHLYKYSGSLFLYSLCLVTGFLFVLYKLALKIFSFIYPGHSPHKFMILNYVVLFFSFFLLINTDFSTFYWLNVSVMYFAGLLFFLLGIYGIFISSPVPSYMLIVVGFFGAGSSAEHLSVMAIVTVFTSLAFVLISKSHLKEADSIEKKLLVAGILSLFAFTIMFFAPGNEIRLQSLEYRTPVPQAFLLAFKSTYAFLWQKLSLKIKYIPVMVSLFLYLGSLLPEKYQNTKDDNNLTKIFLSSTLILFAYYLLNFLLMGYATGNEGPGRAQVIICFLTALYFAFNSILVGMYASQFKQFFLTLSLAAMLLHLNIIRYALKNNYEASLQYSNGDKGRVDHLLSLKAEGIKELQILPPINMPDENIFYTNFIVDDSTYFEYCRNIHLEEGLGLPFKILLKKDSLAKENKLKGTMRMENAMAKQK
jgi:hypothetical protein